MKIEHGFTPTAVRTIIRLMQENYYWVTIDKSHKNEDGKYIKDVSKLKVVDLKPAAIKIAEFLESYYKSRKIMEEAGFEFYDMETETKMFLESLPKHEEKPAIVQEPLSSFHSEE